MKIWTQEHVFSQPWDTVTLAAWNKYPNPFNTNVVGADVIERKLENGLLTSHRILSTKWGVPDWALKILGVNKMCYASEQSTVDPVNKTMTLKSRNLTFLRLVSIDENIVYQPHPIDSSKTILKQETTVEVNGVPLRSYMEQLIINTVSAKADQGRQAIDFVCERINESVDKVTTTLNSEITEFASSARKSMDQIKKEVEDIAETLPSLEKDHLRRGL